MLLDPRAQRVADLYLSGVREAALAIRIADRLVEPFTDIKARSLFSQATLAKLRQAFTIRGLPLFQLYQELYNVSLGLPQQGAFTERFRFAARQIHKLLITEAGRGAFLKATSEIRPDLTRLDAMLARGIEGTALNQIFRKIVLEYNEMIPLVGRERDVFLRGRMMGGSVRWMAFRAMSEKEEQVEKLRKTQPELYQVMQESKQIRKELDRRIEKQILSFNMKPGRSKIMGRLENIGTDTTTGERFVFTTDEDLVPYDEYRVQRRKEEKAARLLNRVFPVDLTTRRTYSDDDIKHFAEGDVEHVALTDDKVLAGAVTRVYPVQKIDGEQVVVDGRFKGIRVPDLINRLGRHIEGVAYDLGKGNRPIRLATRSPDGSPNVKVTREPYVILTPAGRLMVTLPTTKRTKKGPGFTAERNRMMKLAKVIPTMEMAQKGRFQYYFAAQDFAAVRRVLGSLTLSTAAMKHLRDHFTDLAKHELALNKENLKNYEPEMIGGFRKDVTLWVKQKQAMAWLDSKGGAGVAALDTGVGKTALTLASLQKMKRDGLLETARVLYVCPKRLAGNLPKEARKFLQDPDGLLDRVTILTYGQLNSRLRKDPAYGDKFAAIFFDEAHELRSPRMGKNPNTAGRVMSIKNPNKVLLTASPMSRSPAEVFTLAAIASNRHLDTLEERKAFNAEKRAFLARFAETIGNRVVGIKEESAQEFRVWVKQNLYFAEKTEVEEVALPDLLPQTEVLTMDAEVESMYREATQGVEEVFRGMVAKWRDKEPSATDPRIEQAKMQLAALFGQLYRLANMPDKVIPGAANPKLVRAGDIVDERSGTGSRTLLFADSPEMARHTVETLTKRFPGQLHALGLADRIEIWQDGAIRTDLVETASGPKAQKELYRERRYKDANGVLREASEWQTVILDTRVSQRESVTTCTLTKTYALGLNLQAFNTVVHLDRDDWNPEVMKQRTARAWRNGQKNPVEEFTLDAVYENPKDDRDHTLDQIIGHLQHLEGDLFDEVVSRSQHEALGAEYFGMKRMPASILKINRQLMKLSLSPYLARIGQEGL